MQITIISLLLSDTYKILERMMLKRIQSDIEMGISEKQAEFKERWGYEEQVIALS